MSVLPRLASRGGLGNHRAMRPARRSTVRALLLTLLVVVAAACGSSGKAKTSMSSPTGGSSTIPGPEGVALQQGPLLAPPGPDTTDTVNGVKCETSEQVAYHIHAHLAVFVNGVQKAIPGGIGIPGRVSEAAGAAKWVGSGTCFYFLHTHTNDGIIHIESPDARVFTLGDFFAVWGQPLSSTQVGPAKGTVTAYVAGKRYTGDPAKIPLTVHELIQLNVGTPSPPPQKIELGNQV